MKTFSGMKHRKAGRFVLTYFSKNCALDLSEYFSRIFTLDLIILNEDRHLII